MSFEQPQVTLGRGSNCDIRLPFRIISSQHLGFLFEEGRYKVADLGSTNGTLLGKTRLIPNVYVPVVSGMELKILDLTIRLDVDQALSDGFTLADSATMVRKLLVQALQANQDKALGQAFIEILSGAGSGQRFGVADELDEGWIGADPDCLVPLAILHLEPRAICIKRQGDRFALESVSGAIAITINGVPCLSGQVLRSHDHIAIATTVLIFVDPLEGYLDELDEPVASALLAGPLPQPDRARSGDVKGPGAQDLAASAPYGSLELALMAISAALMLGVLFMLLLVLEVF
ncbi:MAG: FHA domain-containing protein [Bradymonadaceae bacterium]|nr:FHA domain-containing protein [Lujinxingiaceae bacterium]